MSFLRLAGGVGALFLLFSWSFPVFAQQVPVAPAVPHKLSEPVQARALALSIWEKTTTPDFDFKAESFPVTFGDPRAREPLQFYLDQLTAADVMAHTRSKAKGQQDPGPEDFDLMFASWCVFIPNKQPNAALATIGRAIRAMDPMVGMYLNPKKREALAEAMRPLLREGSGSDILKALGTIKTLSEYNSQILDTTKLK
jgi:hypothetical protein